MARITYYHDMTLAADRGLKLSFNEITKFANKNYHIAEVVFYFILFYFKTVKMDKNQIVVHQVI